jgi:hypothetical protein
MMCRNSVRIGSGASAARTRSESPSGRPDLMPRTMTSIASGEPVEKSRLPPLLEIRQDPARQAEAGGEGEQRRRDQAGVEDEHRREHDGAQRHAGHDELLLRPGEAGLSEADRQRRRFRFLGPLLEVLEAAFDLLAARFQCARSHLRCRHAGSGDAQHPLFGFLFARQIRVDHHPGHRAGAEGRQQEDRERLHVS